MEKLFGYTYDPQLLYVAIVIYNKNFSTYTVRINMLNIQLS